MAKQKMNVNLRKRDWERIRGVMAATGLSQSGAVRAILDDWWWMREELTTGHQFVRGPAREMRDVEEET